MKKTIAKIAAIVLVLMMTFGMAGNDGMNTAMALTSNEVVVEENVATEEENGDVETEDVTEEEAEVEAAEETSEETIVEETEEVTVEETSEEEIVEEAAEEFDFDAVIFVVDMKETYTAGESLIMNSRISVEADEVSYQWQTLAQFEGEEGAYEEWIDVEFENRKDIELVLDNAVLTTPYRLVVTINGKQVVTEEIVLADYIKIVEEDEVVIDVSKLKVEIESNLDGVIADGTTIVLTSKLTGFEGLTYTMQWQYNDGNGWHDVEGATEGTYSFIADETNASYLWRLSVSL